MPVIIERVGVLYFDRRIKSSAILGEGAGLFLVKTFSPSQTALLGEKIAALLSGGEVICLYGELGAGKTCFVQGLALGLGIKERVTSPTFALIHEYSGRLPLYHMDFYRLGDPLELEALGYEEYFYGQGVCVIEWADRVQELLPHERLDVEISAAGSSEDERIICLCPRGESYRHMAEEAVKGVRAGY